MSDYKKLVKEEAKSFFDSARKEFAEDGGEFGGKSETPNLAKWIDRTGKLNDQLEKLTARWGNKECLWVQSNTRNPSPHGGGDPLSNAFVSLLQDVRREIKKLAKK